MLCGLKEFGSCKVVAGFTVMYPEFFWAEQYIEPTGGNFSKFVTLDALKMHSLIPYVLRFYCKTFSKLLKFTKHSSSQMILKKLIYASKFFYGYKLVSAAK